MSFHAEIDIPRTKQNILEGRASLSKMSQSLPQNDVFRLLKSETRGASGDIVPPLLAEALLKHKTDLFVEFVGVARGLSREQQVYLLYDRVLGEDKIMDYATRLDADKEVKKAARDWAESIARSC